MSAKEALAAMDNWSLSPEQHRRQHKRNFDQMSELLQPLRDQNPFIASSPHPLPNPSTFASTSSFIMPPRAGHQQHHSNSYPPENMAHRRLPMPSLQPTLQHQSSRTVIDLTDDADPPSSQSRRSSQRPGPPPHLDRSDSIQLGHEIITIDSDEEEDVVITGERNRSGPPAAQRYHHGRIAALGPVFARAPPPPPRQVPLPPRHPRHDAHFQWGIGMQGRLQGLLGDFGALAGGHYFFGSPDRDDIELVAAPRMPGMDLNYDRDAFAHRQPRKEEFFPPPPAQDGFTRSPKEDDVIVCPGCDEELQVDPADEPGPEKKPSARKKSKADRAEHPFWVLRDCGHVYCNNCYQNRAPKAKSVESNFPPKMVGGKKVPICAVDGCDSVVTAKDKWVGVFL